MLLTPPSIERVLLVFGKENGRADRPVPRPDGLGIEQSALVMWTVRARRIIRVSSFLQDLFAKIAELAWKMDCTGYDRLDQQSNQ
jgi:hypothetical protein